MKKIIVTTLAIALVAGAATAQTPATPAAAPKPAPIKDMFDALDSNKDGILTKAEYAVQSDRTFAAMDTNKDGKIDTAERDAQRAKWSALRTARPVAPAAAPSTTPAPAPAAR